LCSELLKVATLPAMWWTLLVTAGLGAAIILSALQNDTGGRAFGFDQIAPTWTLAVQIGFVAAGVIVAGAEHSSAQGATTLLVTPARARLAAARLGVLTGAGLVTASVLVSVGVVMCPEISAAALRAGGRSVVWLTAALLLAAGLGEILRSTTGAATAAVVLVVLAPQVAVIAGDAARWLPGQAGQIWVAAAGPRADVVMAGLVVLAWTAVAQAGGILRLIRSDA
jgi:membrane protein